MNGRECSVVFVESNTTGTGRLLVEEALRRGHEVLFCCIDPARYEFVEEFALSPVVVDTTSVDAVDTALGPGASVAAVLSTTDTSLEVAAALAARRGLVGNDPRAIATCQSKPLQYRTLADAGVRVPRGLTIQPRAFDPSALRDARLNFPMVGKPARGTGSIGVRLLRSEVELRDYLRGADVTQTLLQEYIEGDEFSVETLTSGGVTRVLGITRKLLSPPPLFIETGHDFPARLDDRLSQAIGDTVTRALAAVGFTNGPAHTELRVSGDEVVVIEINPRLAGGMIPVLVSNAIGFDLLGHLLDLHLGVPAIAFKDGDRPAAFSAIRHLVAETRTTSGELGLRVPDALPADVIAVHVKPPTVPVGGFGDFRDRCAYVIASGTTADAAASLAESTLASLRDPSARRGDLEARLLRRLQDTGRMQSALDPAIQRLLTPAPAASTTEAELNLYADIDEAHLLMLLQARVVKHGTVYTILNTLTGWRRERFSIFRGLSRPRGLYLTYEGVLSEVLGEHVGGVLQTARSRNDHRATLEKLKLRQRIDAAIRALNKLAVTLLRAAQQHAHTPLPIFSQYQAAMPGTVGHYALAVVSNLLRVMRALQDQIPALQVLPLGACAGAGTCIPITPDLSARLLGFDRPSDNALDAVSEGDTHLRFLAEMDLLATLFTRVAQDLQVFSASGLKLVGFPDALCGGSSAMPQKRNPYLLEHLKALAAAVASDLDRWRAALCKTPLGNSYEANQVAGAVWVATVANIESGAALLGALFAAMEVNESASMDLIRREHATATFAAERLVQGKGIDFRTAHHKVGQCIRNGASGPAGQGTELAEWLADTPAALEGLRHGGGPAPETTLAAAGRQADTLARLMKQHRLSLRAWSDAATRRRRLVADFLATGHTDGLAALAAEVSSIQGALP